LEFCTIDELIEREQFYIDTLKPEYNILKLAHSSIGYKHSMESMEKMRGPRPHFSPSEEHRLAISNTHKGKMVSEKTKEKMSKSKSKPIYVYTADLKTLINVYPGVVIMKAELKASPTVIKNCCLTGKLFRGYRLSYVPLKAK
jgi:group I intron endonuclease